MPSVEFVCDHCGHRFTRLFFRGDNAREAYCASCGSRRVKRQPGPRSLFGDKTPFGNLSKERN